MTATIYVGMGLTNAPKGFREDFQRVLKDALRDIPDVELLDFIGLEDGTEADVYRHDRESTEGADLALFICDHPSIGLGMEIVFRHLTGKLMLLCAATTQRVTRMLTGFATVEHHEFLWYSSIDDIVSEVREYLGYDHRL